MSKVNAILNERLKQNDAQPKMAALAKRSAEGTLTSFSGIFGQTELTEAEKERLKLLLERYAQHGQEITTDFKDLTILTSEVKAINNQAIILHGERIKKAQTILKKYSDGAFSAWLISTYGNRQTPYNFLQYYEFYSNMPKNLHHLIDAMPRQAVYTLASREGSIEIKEKIIQHAQGKTKQELLECIRKEFPLEESDKRKQKIEEGAIFTLKRLYTHLSQHPHNFSENQRKLVGKLLTQIKSLL